MNHEVLKHQVLTSLVRKFEVDYTLGKGLFRQGVSSPTNEYTFDILEYSRDLAKYRDPNAEAGMVSPATRKKTTVTLPTLREKKIVKGTTMNWLRKPGTEHQQYGQQALADELAELNQRLEQRKEWWRWQLLSGGNASGYFPITIDDGVGNTFSATYDFGFDRTNHYEANADWGSGGIIADIIAAKKQIAQQYGKMPTRAYTTEDVMATMIEDDDIGNLLGDSLKDQIALSGYIKRFLGLDITVYEAGYHDGSSWTNFLADTNGSDIFVVVAPDAIGDEVTAPPVDPKAGGQTGKFSKSWVEEDPAGTWLLVEETSMAGLTNPEGIYVIDTAS